MYAYVLVTLQLAACVKNSEVSVAKITNSVIKNIDSITAIDIKTSAPLIYSFKALDLKSRFTPTQIVLEAPLANEFDKLKEENKKSSGPYIIGIGRDIPQTATIEATSRLLKWNHTATGGKIASIKITSLKSKHTELAVSITKFPDNAILRFYAQGDTEALEMKGDEIRHRLAMNIALSHQKESSKLILGLQRADFDNAIVEVELPAGISPNEVEIAIPKLSHDFFNK